MGLNRMMMKSSEVKVEDGSKVWTYDEANNKTISFTVPPGVKRVKVSAIVDTAESDSYVENSAGITNTSTKKVWGVGHSYANGAGENEEHENIDSVVGVTPNKTYTLHFDCYYTSGVTFSWGKAINALTPTVEDY